MLNDIASELIVTGFLALLRRLSDILHREEFDDSFFPVELATMSEKEYQEFVDKYVANREWN